MAELKLIARSIFENCNGFRERKNAISALPKEDQYIVRTYVENMCKQASIENSRRSGWKLDGSMSIIGKGKNA